MLTDAAFKFAFESLKKYMLMEPENNVFFSPHLIYHNLLMMYFGAIDNFENSLKRVLYIPDDVSKDIVKQYYFKKGANQFVYRMYEPFYMCKIISQLWITNTKMIDNETLKIFSSGVYKTDLIFGKSIEATQYINDLIRCITKSCITNMFPPTTIKKNTEIFFLNMIYCKGQLDVISDVSNHENTKNRGHSKNKNISNGRSEQLGAYIIEVPYKEKKISIFFFYPSHCLESNEDSFTESDRIIQLIERLTTEEGSRELRKLLNEGIEQQTFAHEDMMFPTFKIVQDLRMYELLDMLGVPELSSSGTAYLNKFTLDSNLKLGGAMHRINIEMTENDIIVAACNTFFTSNSCQGLQTDKITTVMDSTVCFPCVCLIYDKSHQNILFCGVLLNDNKESKLSSEKPCNDEDKA